MTSAPRLRMFATSRRGIGAAVHRNEKFGRMLRETAVDGRRTQSITLLGAEREEAVHLRTTICQDALEQRQRGDAIHIVVAIKNNSFSCPGLRGGYDRRPAASPEGRRDLPAVSGGAQEMPWRISRSPKPFRIRTRARNAGTLSSRLRRRTAKSSSGPGKIHRRCISGFLRVARQIGNSFEDTRCALSVPLALSSLCAGLLRANDLLESLKPFRQCLRQIKQLVYFEVLARSKPIRCDFIDAVGGERNATSHLV